ncbi:hypothetical protein CEXT_487311 [Caerostris extrusa]|uniref:Uncharacterized protein n=1 Tax=Caerostris extrusa TaxID=172846 RepID=A0AAV4T8P9_CAEEX|nr:hypothetical protein CEXT_487311 [Caerostris extrusa]
MLRVNVLAESECSLYASQEKGEKTKKMGGKSCPSGLTVGQDDDISVFSYHRWIAQDLGLTGHHCSSEGCAEGMVGGVTAAALKSWHIISGLESRKI